LLAGSRSFAGQPKLLFAVGRPPGDLQEAGVAVLLAHRLLAHSLRRRSAAVGQHATAGALFSRLAVFAAAGEARHRFRPQRLPAPRAAQPHALGERMFRVTGNPCFDPCGDLPYALLTNSIIGRNCLLGLAIQNMPLIDAAITLPGRPRLGTIAASFTAFLLNSGIRGGFWFIHDWLLVAVVHGGH
jgi:hypothetical protein